jgi:hypothetical protein
LNCIKSCILGIVIIAVGSQICNGQIKETAQLATLSPAVFVIYSDHPEHYEKNHYLLSTIGYMGSYMILESKWKAALLTLALGAGKELVYDGLFNKGEPLWSDMKWNALGVGQGVVFTVSLEF